MIERADAVVDWDVVKERNREALVRLVATLFAMIGAPSGGRITVLPRLVYFEILRLLRPAESAFRRLVILYALSLSVLAPPKRPAPTQPIPKGSGQSGRIPPFVLFDPRKWFPELAQSRPAVAGNGPRISGFDEEWTAFPQPPAPVPPPAEVDATRLYQRLQALQKGLEDVPAQARRLARLQARRRADAESLKRTEPLRPGWPPGYRRKPIHPVDDILADCHAFARYALDPNDTS